MSDTQTQPRCPMCGSDDPKVKWCAKTALGNHLVINRFCVECTDPWHRQANAPAFISPPSYDDGRATEIKADAPSKEVMPIGTRPVQPKPVNLAGDHRAAEVTSDISAASTAGSAQEWLETDEGTLVLRQGDYLATMEAYAAARTSELTRELMLAHDDLAAARSESSQFQKLYEDAFGKLKAAQDKSVELFNFIDCFSDVKDECFTQEELNELRRLALQAQAALGKPEGTK